jgi:hypothetical protein
MADARWPIPALIRTSVSGCPDVPVISGCELVSVLSVGDGAIRVVVVVIVVDVGTDGGGGAGG